MFENCFFFFIMKADDLNLALNKKIRRLIAPFELENTV